MFNREDVKKYALDICVPVMERCAERAERGIYAEKADQVGFIPSFLENFCRPFWGIAPILAQGEEIFLNVGERRITVFEYMRETLSRGFSADGSGWSGFRKYFGAYAYENQNITEFAGLLVGIFFAREQLWKPLNKAEKDLYAKELYNMALDAFNNSWPNNHYWFPLFTVTVLKRLGYCFEETERMLREGLSFLDGLYEGDGWYSDGVFGRFDYYEAWSLHMYPLLWTLIADESFEDYREHKETYIKRTNEFLDFYAHWFGSDGAQAAFGRSLSYRFAASSLFPVAIMAGCDFDPSLAGRITAKNIEFFKNNCRNESDGVLPEGYLYKSPCVVEGYTSDGGAYWCCKTFLALLMDGEHPFWQTEGAKLPSEQGDYVVRPSHKNINMVFAANDGIVTMYNNTSQYYQEHRHTHRFGNMRNWYTKFAYNSGTGFACSSPDVVSADSMICLSTPDESMMSHRLGIEDFGYDGEFLHSAHTPFANDPETVIETWILPLGNAHVRVHRVRLAREYTVSEGSFALGRWDDYRPSECDEKRAVVENRDMFSLIQVAAEVPVELYIENPHAGYHLYAPLASYPAYRTKQPLGNGEYIFAAVCAAGRLAAKNDDLPETTVEGNHVVVESRGKRFELKLGL